MSRTSRPAPSHSPASGAPVAGPSPRRRLAAALTVAAAVTGIVVAVPSTLDGAGAGRDSSVVISEDADGDETETDRPEGASRSGLRSLTGSGANAKTPPDPTTARQAKPPRSASTGTTSKASRRLLRSIEAAAAKAAERDRAAERRAAQQGQEDGTGPTDRPSDGAVYDVSGNRALGLRLMLDFGFDRDQWPALEALWTRESGWNHLADNPTSSAYGIPQSLPGSKMASAGPDWATNPSTQIRWGLGYIADRYGSPKTALAHSDSVGWY